MRLYNCVRAMSKETLAGRPIDLYLLSETGFCPEWVSNCELILADQRFTLSPEQQEIVMDEEILKVCKNPHGRGIATDYNFVGINQNIRITARIVDDTVGDIRWESLADISPETMASAILLTQVLKHTPIVWALEQAKTFIEWMALHGPSENVDSRLLVFEPMESREQILVPWLALMKEISCMKAH